MFDHARSINEKLRGASLFEKGIVYMERINQRHPDDRLGQAILHMKANISSFRYRAKHPDMFKSTERKVI